MNDMHFDLMKQYADLDHKWLENTINGPERPIGERYETRQERRARERAEAKAARKAA